MAESQGIEHEPGIFEIMYNMRSMRRLKPDPVPEEILLKLIEAATKAPNGSNLQPVRWIIVRDKEQRQRLADNHRAEVAARPERPLWQQPQMQGKFAREIATREYLLEHIQDIPALIIACSIVDPNVPVEARRGTNASSVWPAVQNLLLAARAYGLGAFPSGIALRYRENTRKILELPDNMEAHATVPVGYPMGHFGPVTRLPVADVMRFDRWSK